MSRIMPLEVDQRRVQEAIIREREYRWTAKAKARVVHPKYGEVVVPCRSKYSAVLCAAEWWRCEWLEIIDAQVWWADPPEQKEKGQYT